MKIKTLIVLGAIAVTFGWHAKAQIYDTNNEVVQTFAGSGFSGYVDGVGQLTMFKNPNAIVADSRSNLFVWDSGNYRIRKITQDSTVSTFAGGGTQSTGIGTNVSFNGYSLTGMAIDRNDTIWMVGIGLFYKITSNGTVTSHNGVNLNASGICADSFGNIYISDEGNIIYRYDTNGVLSVFAGSGNLGHADGNGIFTSFNSPRTLSADTANNIYVWDYGNALIRKIDQNQNVTTFAGIFGNFGYGGVNRSDTDGVGTNASFNSIFGMCFDNSGNLILACNGSIRRISPATNTVTMAGSFTQFGYTNGVGNFALFGGASGVCVSQDMVFVADSGNNRIRDITYNQVVSPANLQLNIYPVLQIIGTVGRNYQIQTSPDMNTWTTTTTLLLNSSPYLWIDQNPVSGNKFYRALMLP